MEKQLQLMRLVEAAAHSPTRMLATESKALPLTDAQRDVWIICQLSSEGSAAYNLSSALSLTGDLDVEALHQSMRRLVERHEALRTTFDATGHQQVVSASVDVALPIVDMSDTPEAERAQAVAAFLDSDLSTPYDLVNGPLFRPALIRLDDTDHLLVLSAHHLVCDGWSFGVLQRELGAIYSSVVADERISLEHATQYSEFAAWRIAQSSDSEPYWLGLYEDPPAELDLPADAARPPSPNVRLWD